jgi:hypothetical protein
LKKIVILISSAALHTSATHAIDFKNVSLNVSFPVKNCQIQAVAGANLKYVTCVICAHFNAIYIRAYTVVICHF